MKNKLRLILKKLLGVEVLSEYGEQKVNKALTEIISLAKECAPHQFDTNYNAETVDQRKIKQYEMGWNENGKQFLANIEGER